MRQALLSNIPKEYYKQGLLLIRSCTRFKHEALPICEMVLTDQSALTITTWLSKFLYDVFDGVIGNVSKIEVDFSWAMINASLTAFNKQTRQYLKNTFQVYQGGKNFRDVDPIIKKLP